PDRTPQPPLPTRPPRFRTALRRLGRGLALEHDPPARPPHQLDLRLPVVHEKHAPQNRGHAKLRPLPLLWLPPLAALSGHRPAFRILYTRPRQSNHENSLPSRNHSSLHLS